MSKVKVCRASGLPVQIENLEKFSNAYRSAYDRLMQKKGITENALLDQNKAEILHKILSRYERMLYRAYPVVEYWEPITEQETWLKLVEKVGPVMIAKDASDGSVAYVIYDVAI